MINTKKPSGKPGQAPFEVWGKTERTENLRDPFNPSLGHTVSRRRTDRNLERSAEQSHEAIISTSAFLAVQAKMEGGGATQKSERPAKRAGTRQFRFSGLIRCGICGRKMHGWTRTPTAPHQYQCRASRLTDDSVRAKHPRTVYLREDAAATAVDAWLGQLFDADHLDETIAQLTAHVSRLDTLHAARIKRVRADLEEARKRHRNLMTAIETGIEVDHAVAQRLRALSASVAELEVQFSESVEIPSAAGEARLRELLGGFTDAARSVFTEGDPAVVRRFYEAIGLALTYDASTGRLVADVEIGTGRGSVDLGLVKRV